MSDKDYLEHNVAELLRRAHQPPQIDGGARARILADLESRLEAREAADIEKPAPRAFLARLFGSPRRAVLVAGFSVAAATAAGYLLLAGGGDGVDRFEAVTHRNDEPAPRRIELADGSTAILRSGAELIERAPRRVELVGGDVLFDVVKGQQDNGGRSFVVRRAGQPGRVVVLGTRFVVSAEKGTTLAAVIRGRVRLESSGDTLELGAGEGGEMAGAAPVRRPVKRLSALTSWAKSARKRSEGKDVEPARRGNLVARFPNWGDQDYPLPVRDLTVDVHVENQIARVAVDQTFFNEQPFQLEGIYSFTLPPNAAISRLAMYVEENLMEAGLAERVRARQVYESIVYRRRDPALMEWMQGNEVKVRIFPLPARQEKRILLSYTQPLERLYDDVKLSIPLPRLDQPIGQINFRARLTECARCEVASTSHSIQTAVDGADLLVTYKGSEVEVADDLLLTIRQPRDKPSVSVEKADFGHYLIARIKPKLSTGEPAVRARRRWVIVDDTSASREPLERAAQTHIADRLLDELDERDQVAMIAFDSTVRRFDGGKFSDVSNLQARAVHEFLETESADGVGATDLGAALAAAAELLGSAIADGYEPYVIYLGDGVVTGGTRKTSELVARIKDRAAFVGVAVGARQDRAVLEALAAETGGAVWNLNPGDDLDWSVFDMVAALNTPRVTRLRAEVDGDRPGDDPEPVYLSTAQLADGEELMLVTRVGETLPATITLRGRQNGDEWTHRVALADAEVERGAGYLPRLWAQRRIAALLADEQTDHEEAIVELAMKHWLLTPHTSLLVLENDEAYKRFKVARSSASGWAAYQVPGKIKVVREPLTSVAALSKVSARAMIFRDPLELFQQAYNGPFNGGWGTIGTGAFGTIGAGSGGGGLALRAATTTESFKVLEKTVREESEEVPAEPARAIDETKSADVGAADKVMLDGEVRVQTQGFNRERAKFEVRRKNLAGKSASDRPLPMARPRGSTRRSGASRGPRVLGRDFTGRSSRHAYYWRPMSAPVPIALHHSADLRFDDLSAVIDGLYSDALDRERARLLRLGGGGERHPVAAAAREKLDRARELAAGRRYSIDGASIEISSGGKLRLTRTTAIGLREQLHYDGNTLTTHYPDLGINLRRVIGDVEPWLLESEAPMLAPGADALSRFYTLSVDPAGVVATPDDKDATWSLVYKIDDRGRLAGIERRGENAGELMSIGYDGDQVIVGVGDSELRYGSVALPVVLPPSSPAGVTIDMPLRHPKLWEAALADKASTGRAGKARRGRATMTARETWTQLLASHAALGDRAAARDAVNRMLEAGLELSPAELVIGSAGILALEDRPFARALAPAGDHPAARYLRAARRFRRDNAVGHLEAIGRDESWFGTFALYRRALRDAEQGIAPFKRTFAELVKRDLSPVLRYIAVNRINQYQLWQKPLELVELWDQVAPSGSWHVAATVQAANALLRGARYEQAAKRYEALVDESLAAGELPPLDYNVRNAFASGPRGQAGWMAFWTGVRERVIDSGDSALIVELLRASMNMGQQTDVERLTTAALDLDLDGEIRLELIGELLTHGRRAEAGMLFRPLWKSVDDGTASDPDLYAWASAFREQQGRFMSAASLYDKHLALIDDETAALDQVRGELTRLLELYSSAARLSVSDRPRALAGARDVAARWRAVDPDNPQIDQRMSTLLFAVSRDQEAMRYLMTAIERHPMEGTAYNTVATVLQNGGRVEDAARLWERAAEIEPDNPTWSLHSARARVALGQSDVARAQLDKIVAAKKTTHERFAWIVSQAEALRKQLE